MDSEVLSSLRKSAVRRSVLNYLASNPEGSYPAEIARKTHYSAMQILGALRGVENMYKPERSLVALGLVKICGGTGRSIK